MFIREGFQIAFIPPPIWTGNVIDSGDPKGDALVDVSEDSAGGIFNSWFSVAFTIELNGLSDYSSLLLADITILTAYGSGFFNIISESELPSIPEPATLVLMTLGLAGIGFSRRKKKV